MKVTPQKYRLYLLMLAVLLVTFLYVYVQLQKKYNTGGNAREETINETAFREGERLSLTYCGSCHLYPGPELLDKRTWVTQTLQAMGPKMGIFSHHGIQYHVETDPWLPEDYYPSEPMVTKEEWQQILDFYEHTAPEKLLPAIPDVKINTDPLFFRARAPAYRSGRPPLITAVRFDPGNRHIYAHDASEGKLYVFNKDLDPIQEFNSPSPITHINFTNDIYKPGRRDYILTLIGSLDPSDAPLGALVESWYDHEANKAHAALLIDNISRPVQSQIADLKGDGTPDLLVSEFGHRKGRLFWINNMGREENPEKHVLKDVPGCIQAHVTDYNNNGLPDIVALCTQAVQSIYLFLNQGNGEFTEKTLLTFQSVAGSMSFEMHDFNGNGHPDILYTSGDNADYSTILKPYHGVYIYLNDGNDNFTKAWFYPMNGAYHAKARDFDGDGNLDIAAIAFFADYKNKPEEGFVFFKNQKDRSSDGWEDLSFVPYHHPEASRGLWITMDIEDWTGNGYDDIILANFSTGITEEHAEIEDKWKEGPAFLVLENMTAPAQP